MANPKNVILIDDKATWDKWKKICDEVEAEMKEEIDRYCDELGIKRDDEEVEAPEVPNVINPWEALGMTEEEWDAEIEAEADSWDD
jgi:hypothetical protein